MRRIRVVASTALLLVAGCQNPAAGEPSQSGPVIEIASEFTLGVSGMVPVEQAVDLAVAQHPTIDGYRLVHVPLDDTLGQEGNFDRVVQNVKREVDESQILGVVGPHASDEAMFMIPRTAPANLVVISPSNTVDCLTDPVDPCYAGPPPHEHAANYFRISARDSVNARAAADFAFRRLGISSFAVLTNAYADPSWQLMADAFSKEFTSLGGKVVLNQLVPPLAPSYAPVLRDAYADGAQAIYLSGGDEACGVRRDMRGIFPPSAYFIGTDFIASDYCIQSAGFVGKTDDHMLITISSGQPTNLTPALKALTRRPDSDTYTFAAYDCARILIDAIDRAIRANGGKVPTRQQVRLAVAQTAGFRGITGTFSFDANGDVVTPSISFYDLNHGAWTFSRNA